MDRVVLALLLTLLVIGCTGDDDDIPTSCAATPGMGQEHEFLDLHVHFTGETAVAGKTIHIITYDAGDVQRVYGTANVVVDAMGSFDQVWPNAYRRYDYQPIVYYVDIDDDGVCTSGVDVGEHVFSTAWNPVGDQPLDERLAVFPLLPVSAAICSDVARCVR